MNKQLLFIHIPKTAGTSFRKAAENYFGDQNIFYDYSPSSVETSKSIRQFVYEKQDIYLLSKAFEKKEELFLSGHFHVTKYMPLFETLNTVTFLRDPVEQVLSHYQHHCRDLGYGKDLTTFIKDKRFKNFQSRLLQGKPLELFGFVGLTERYSESVEMINDYYGLELEVLTANVNRKKELTQKTIDKETLDLIKKENAIDMLLYEKAKKMFDERLECYENNEKYVHLWIQEKSDKVLRGCAFAKDVDKPIELEVYSEEKLIERIKAKSFRPGLVVHGLPRKAFVGFEYAFKNSSENKLLSNIEFKISNKNYEVM